MTATNEVRTEAAIYAEGTRYTASELTNAYSDYVARCEREGVEPDDCQRFFDAYISD